MSYDLSKYPEAWKEEQIRKWEQFRDESYRKKEKLHSICRALSAMSPLWFIAGCTPAAGNWSDEQSVLYPLLCGALFCGVILAIVWIFYGIRSAAISGKVTDADPKLEYPKYSAEFDRAAQELSGQYRENPLEDMVFQWLVPFMDKEIQAANRANTVQTITVPFCFSVSSNCVRIGYSQCFDFGERRIANLPGCLEEAALAKVLMFELEAYIAEHYSVDPSGTPSSVKSQCTYTRSETYINLTYTASNGNYEAIQTW